MSATVYGEGRTDFNPDARPEPLSDKEKQLLARLLSDPAELPKEFKLWITQHSSDTVDIAKTQVHGLVNSAGQVVIGGASMKNLGAALCGCLLPYAGVAAPEGWLICQGQELLRANYTALFALLGTTWGTPTDGTKFKIPDLRGRTPVGVDGNFPFGGSDGLAAGARGHKHNFGIEADIYSGGSTTSEGVGGHQHFGSSGSGYTDAAGAHSHQVNIGIWGHLSVVNNQTGLNGHGWANLNWIIGSGVIPV